jgi:hypothetical protein
MLKKRPDQKEKIVLRVPRTVKEYLGGLTVKQVLTSNAAVHAFIQSKAIPQVLHPAEVQHILTVPHYRWEAFKRKAQALGISLNHAFVVGIELLRGELNE